MTETVTDLVKIQYPTNEAESLQRSITQIKELLEDPEFYRLIAIAASSSAAAGDATGGDCCGNVDGGQADTNFGGIFCPIDGGDAGGSANPTP